MLGLFAKVVVFQAPVEQGTGWLAVVMAVNVVVGLYYYLARAGSLYARRAPIAAACVARRPVPRLLVGRHRDRPHARRRPCGSRPYRR